MRTIHMFQLSLATKTTTRFTKALCCVFLLLSACTDTKPTGLPSPEEGQSQVPPGDPQDLESFRRCVSAAGTGDQCLLKAGLYEVASEIEVARSQITIRGAGDGKTVLKRMSSEGAVMMVGRTGRAPLKGIVVDGLTFDGGYPTLTCTGICVDFWVQGVCATPESCRGEVQKNGPPYAITISNNRFLNAPAHSVAFYTNEGTPANDILFTKSLIHNARLTGLLVGGGDDFTYTECDNGAELKWAPGNITVDTAEFVDSHTGAFGINIARHFVLNNSTFKNNYWNPVPELPAGGSVFFDQCSQHVTITKNKFFGPKDRPGNATEAMELWSRNTLVKDNEVSDYPTSGINLHSVQNAIVEDNLIYNNNRFSTVNPGWRTSGIIVWNREKHRRTEGVTIRRNRIANRNGINMTFGIWVMAYDNPDFQMSGVVVENNNIMEAIPVAALCVDRDVNLAWDSSFGYRSECTTGDVYDPLPVTPWPRYPDASLRSALLVAANTPQPLNWDQWNFYLERANPQVKRFDPFEACVADRSAPMPVDTYLFILDRAPTCGQSANFRLRNALAIRTWAIDTYTFDEWNYFLEQETGRSVPPFELSGIEDRDLPIHLDHYTHILDELDF